MTIPANATHSGYQPWLVDHSVPLGDVETTDSRYKSHLSASNSGRSLPEITQISLSEAMNTEFVAFNPPKRLSKDQNKPNYVAEYNQSQANDAFSESSEPLDSLCTDSVAVRRRRLIDRSSLIDIKYLLKTNVIPMVLLACAWAVISPAESFHSKVSGLTAWLTLPTLLLVLVLFILPYLELYREWLWLWIAVNAGCVFILIAFFTGGV